MKQDECDLIIGKLAVKVPDKVIPAPGKVIPIPIHVPIKRMNWILTKWLRRGWWRPATGLTRQGLRVGGFVRDNERRMPKFDRRVVIVHFKTMPATIGILMEHGDNGWYFYTQPTLRRRTSWSVSPKDIAYIEPHPAPAALWRRLNYLAWMKHGYVDFFHSKRGSLWRPLPPYADLLVGACFPWCQCQHLGVG